MATWLFAARCSWQQVLPRVRHMPSHAPYSYQCSSWLLHTVLSPFRSFSATFVSPISELNGLAILAASYPHKYDFYGSAKPRGFGSRISQVSRIHELDMVTLFHKK